MRYFQYFGRHISHTVILLLIIILAGIFLRTYHFRDWLYFYPDQARDLDLVQNIISGTSSWPFLGPIAASSPFRLGPMYYYFQITSGEIFGVRPETMAYPDLFFGILSIPLLFYFLRRYFAVSWSLSLTGLYSISYFAVRYSRFAWNTNPIPFFSLLFLISLLEFMTERKKTKWPWAVALGIAIGVDIQLHTVLLIMLPVTTLLIFGYLLWKRSLKWSMLSIIIAFILICNTGQLTSEFQTHFHNARYFWTELTARSPQGSGGFLKNVTLDILCHAQASTHLITSLDNKDYCNTAEDIDAFLTHWTDIRPYGMTLGSLIFGLIFIVSAFFSWQYFLRRETDFRKKQFLILIALYSGASFLVLFPVMDDNAPLRYFLPTIFIPLIFLGLIAEYLRVRFSRYGAYAACGFLIFCGLINLHSLGSAASAYAQSEQSRSNYVVLGELEQMRDYILSQSSNQSEIYFMGKQKFYQNYSKPFDFVFGSKGVNITKVEHGEGIVSGKSLFYMADEGEVFLANDIVGHPIVNEKHIGHVVLFMLKNE